MLPIPEETLQKLISICPDFGKQWHNENNVFRNDDGSFTHHGIFIELSHFIHDRFHIVSETSLQEIFDFIEVYVTNDPNDDLDNAICTCFLENLSCEPILSAELRLYMGAKSKQFFDLWDFPENI